MSGETQLMQRVQQFAIKLVENSGGIVEWSPDSDQGMGIVPAAVAECLGQSSEIFALSPNLDAGGLALTIGGSFLENAGRTLKQFIPAAGLFTFPDMPVRKSDFQQSVDSCFGWQNARARVTQVNIVPLAYHSWWFQVTLRTEDAWESVLSTTINVQSSLPVELGNAIELLPYANCRPGLVSAELSIAAAVRSVEVLALKQSASFLTRMDQRLQADRRRLRDYYNAMLRESTQSNRRTKQAPTPTELEDRQRIVKLELQRKLSELDERFSISGDLRPIAVAELRIPSAVIELEVQRRSAKRIFHLYWNGSFRRLEPLECSQCHTGAFNFWFTNEGVEPICATCHASPEKSITEYPLPR